MNMQTRTFVLRFSSPAFLGDAEQNAAWRTPPIKALLRQWWRVAYAAKRNYRFNVSDMRHEEGLLFGHAWLEDDKDVQGNKAPARQSRVRLRLYPPNASLNQAWTAGTQQGVAPLPEGLATSYAWFGLINRGNGLPNRTGIKADAPEGVRELRLAAPDGDMEQLDEVVSLVDAFGLLGSRSRGGWGALHVEGAKPFPQGGLKRYSREMLDCLHDDWPMSLASDNKGLCIWNSENSYQRWDSAMKFIAAERKNVRTSLALTESGDLRAALGFAGTGRMPSPLRWKIVPENGELKVRIFAMPHSLPAESGRRMSANDLKKAWEIVCDALDSAQGRIKRSQ
jgi:CRISPR-associated protein Cmr1